VKETRFIEQNKEKWSQFESHLNEPNIEGDDLKNIFIQVTDDLSYARTFYNHRSVKVYLNELSQNFFSHIYKNRTGFGQAFKNFWSEGLPQICYDERRTIFISTIILIISICIGVFSSLHDKTFINTILGDEYVSLTKENIANGKPFNVYADEGQIDMFLSIGTNNLKACFVTFIFGLVLGIGSLGMLLYMGIMIGAFHTLFFQVSQQLLINSLLTVWLHGTIEISSLIISAAAGLVLSKGILFPGTLSRWQAFQLSGRRAVKMIVGIFPFIIIAAFIESFITRYDATPAIVKILLIVASLVLMIGYFVWYPFYKSKKGFISELNDIYLIDTPTKVEQPNGVQTNSDALGSTFFMISKLAKNSVMYIGILSIIATLWYMFFDVLPNYNTNNYFYDSSYFTNFESVFNLFFNWSEFGFLSVYYILALAILMIVVAYHLQQKWQVNLPTITTFFIQKIIYVLPAVIFINAILLIPSWWKLIAIAVEYPLLFLWCFVICFYNINFIDSFKMAWNYYWGSIAKNMGLNLTLLLFITSLFALIGNPISSNYLFKYYQNIIEWNISVSTISLHKIYYSLQFFITCVIGFFSIFIWFMGNALHFFSLHEIHTANHLQQKINQIRTKK
jgi:uncharacterized membrane protein SpoIIM required for sporulation